MRGSGPPNPPSGWGPGEALQFPGPGGACQKDATQPYKAPPQRAAEIIKGIDYDAAQKIRFRADHALWRGGPPPDPRPSSISAAIPPIRWCFTRWKTAGRAKSLTVSDYFDYSTSGIDTKTLANLDLRFRTDGRPGQADRRGWLSRAPAISVPADRMRSMARRRAVSPSTPPSPRRRNFPLPEFWLEPHGPVTTIYALLDGPSITGASQVRRQEGRWPSAAATTPSP